MMTNDEADRVLDEAFAAEAAAKKAKEEECEGANNVWPIYGTVTIEFFRRDHPLVLALMRRGVGEAGRDPSDNSYYLGRGMPIATSYAGARAYTAVIRRHGLRCNASYVID